MKRIAALLIAGVVTAAAQDPSAVSAEPLSGSFDIRNRFVNDVDGMNNVYRSVVNLGEGPRLYDADLLFKPTSGLPLDQLTLRGSAWGGDPYNTVHLTAVRQKLYDFRFDYRALAYFNNLPTFANPLLGDGMMLSQRSIDLTRRNFDAELRLKPTSRFSPFLAFYRSGGDGRGTTNFYSNANEFPVATDLDDAVNVFRGGLKINLQRWNFTAEQGRTGFSDNQRMYLPGSSLSGNRPGTFNGAPIELTGLDQRYRVDGDGWFSRGLLEGRPTSWVSFSGQFLHSQAEIDSRQSISAQGSLVTPLLQPFSNLTEDGLADASQPRTSAGWNTELRPHAKVRIIQSWFTDRYRITTGASLTQLFNTTAGLTLEQAALNRLEMNYNQHQVDVVFDPSRHVSLRGGHRYIFGDAQTPAPSLSFGGPSDAAGEVRRHVGLGGASVRLGGRLRISADIEASPGDKTFFRTGLMDYKKGKARARYQLREDLTLTASYAILDNRNPDPAIDFDFQSRQTSASLYWTPRQGRYSVLADYSHSTLRSDIQALKLPFFGTQILSYRDQGDHGGLYVSVALPREARVTLGGRYSTNDGSRPTNYYQPQAGVEGPIAEGFRWKAEWIWYGFNEDFLGVENFRAHTFSAGFTANF